MKKHKESDVLKACTDWLETNGYLYLRHNAISPVTCGRPGVYKKVRESQKGGPDIIVFYKVDFSNLHIPWNYLRVVAVECKSSTGKLSPAQENWKRRAEKRGVQYVVVREISDLVKVLED